MKWKVKRKHIFPGKCCRIQKKKDNTDNPGLSLQTQLFGKSICHRIQKIIQNHLSNYKLSKTFELGFMAR